MFKITLESEVKQISITSPNFDPNSNLVDYFFELRNAIVAYGFDQNIVDEFLGFENENISNDINLDDEKFEN